MNTVGPTLILYRSTDSDKTRFSYDTTLYSSILRHVRFWISVQAVKANLDWIVPSSSVSGT